MAKGSGSGKTPERLVELLNKAVAEKSQSAVSKETGLGLAAINRYVKGVGEPTTKTLQIFADYFGESIWSLRGEKKSSESIWPSSFWPTDKDSFLDVLNLTAQLFDHVLTNSIVDEKMIAAAMLSAVAITNLPIEVENRIPMDDLRYIKKQATAVYEKFYYYEYKHTQP